MALPHAGAPSRHAPRVLPDHATMLRYANHAPRAPHDAARAPFVLLPCSHTCSPNRLALDPCPVSSSPRGCQPSTLTGVRQWRGPLQAAHFANAWHEPVARAAGLARRLTRPGADMTGDIRLARGAEGERDVGPSLPAYVGAAPSASRSTDRRERSAIGSMALLMLCRSMAGSMARSTHQIARNGWAGA